MTGTDERVPVTVIGGYLGAGKTTLVNRLLSGDHGRRLAVLVNDFGDVDIDLELIEAHDGRTISLTNGCVCCSIADALGDGLDRVLTTQPPPDQILIEASGVADPGKVAAYGQGWPGCRLDGIVVLADVETIRARAEDRFVGHLVVQQLRRADLIVATKCDLIDDATVTLVTDWMAAVGGGPVIAAIEGPDGVSRVVDLLLAGDGMQSLGVAPAMTPAHGKEPLGVDGAGTDAANAWDVADRLFSSATIDVAQPLERAALERALDRWPDSIVRVKGLVEIEDDEGRPGAHRPHVVHRVGRRWSIEPLPTNDPDRNIDSTSPDRHRRSRLVVISVGQAPDPSQLRDQLLGQP